MRIGMIIGPGQHAFVQAEQLLKLGHEVHYTYYLPGFEYGRFELDSDGKATRKVISVAKARDWLTRKIHAVLLRLDLGRAHVQFHTWYGRWAAQQLQDCELIIAYSIVALDAIKRYKATATKVILELPMAHVDEVWHKRKNAPVRGLGDRFASPAFRNLIKTELHQADYINVISTYANESCTRAGISPEKLALTPLGIDLRRFPSPRPKQSSDFQLLFVGRLEYMKGVDVLVDALRSIDAPDITLRLAGRVTTGFDVDTLSSLKVETELLGHLSFNELLEAYQEADVMVFPTRSDGMGLVICEAMACGVPVITTTSSGGPDIITDGEDGLLVPPEDPAALHDAILRVYNDRTLLSQLASKTRAVIEADFTLDAYRSRITKMIAKCA